MKPSSPPPLPPISSASTLIWPRSTAGPARALVEGLSEPERNLEVTEAIRALVERIVLTPELKDGCKRATLTADLEGALAAIARLVASTKTKAARS